MGRTSRGVWQELGRRPLPSPPSTAAPNHKRQNDNEPPRGRLVTLTLNRRRPTLPGPFGPSTIGAERLNCSVRNGKRCFPLAVTTGNRGKLQRRQGRAPSKLHSGSWALKSSPRMISTGLLNALLRLHIPPINLVVYQDPYSLKGMGELISRWASRLDAFSGYPIQT